MGRETARWEGGRGREIGKAEREKGKRLRETEGLGEGERLGRGDRGNERD